MESISDFETLSDVPGFIKLGSHAYEYRPSGAMGTLALVALVHGNEVGGLDIILKIINQIISGIIRPQINIRFILGNVQAFFSNERFIDTDLNRSFSISNPNSLEEKRALEIENMIKGTDLLIDFHQTLESCQKPFFIFSYTHKNFSFARALSSQIPIVTFNSFSLSTQGKGLSSMANSLGMIAITVETGEKGRDSNQTILGVDLVQKSIKILENNISFDETQNTLENSFTWGEVITNPGFRLELCRRFKNFENVSVDENIAKSDSILISSPISGPVLFPKYDKYRLQSHELIRILKPIKSWDELK